MDRRSSLVALGAAPVRIAFLMTCGVFASAQIGKAIIAVPLIREEFGAGVGVAGLVVATFATLGATMGAVAGAAVRRIGLKRALTLGMFAIAAGNLIGAFAPNATVLVLARVVEGVGFFGTIIAIPSMLSVIATREERTFVMALWSAYMPAGITIMLFLAPVAASAGWRDLWLMNATAASALGLGVWKFAPPVRMLNPPSANAFLSDVGAVICEPNCRKLAAGFFLNSCQIFSMIFALPLLLAAGGGIGAGKAGALSAAVMMVSTAGHLLGGVLLRRGAPIRWNIAATFTAYAFAWLALASGSLPPAAIVLLAAFALGFGGLAPAALYAAASEAAPGVARLAPTIGVLQQASNLGQFVGPVALGYWAQSFGWTSVASVAAPAALAGLILALFIRRAGPAEPLAASTLSA